MDVETGIAFNHVGHCVADVERSRRFYTGLLGFTVERELRPPDDPTAKLLGLPPPLGLTALYLRRGELLLELLHFADLGTTARRERVMNEPGLTHLSLSVDDVAGLLERVQAYGGAVLDDTDIGFGVFVRDPDGQLIELLPMAYRSWVQQETPGSDSGV